MEIFSVYYMRNQKMNISLDICVYIRLGFVCLLATMPLRYVSYYNIELRKYANICGKHTLYVHRVGEKKIYVKIRKPNICTAPTKNSFSIHIEETKSRQIPFYFVQFLLASITMQTDADWLNNAHDPSENFALCLHSTTSLPPIH